MGTSYAFGLEKLVDAITAGNADCPKLAAAVVTFMNDIESQESPWRVSSPLRGQVSARKRHFQRIRFSRDAWKRPAAALAHDDYDATLASLILRADRRGSL
jgi:hypothetical protein